MPPGQDPARFGHHFRRGVLDALIHALRENVTDTCATRAVIEGERRRTLQKLHHSLAQWLEQEKNAALKAGDTTAFHQLFPAAATEQDYLALQQSGSAPAQLLAQWYDAVLAPQLIRQAADLSGFGGPEEFRRQTLAALATDYPAAFGSVLQRKENEALRIALQRLMLRTLQHTLEQHGQHLAEIKDRLTRFLEDHREDAALLRAMDATLQRVEAKVDQVDGKVGQVLEGQREQAGKMDDLAAQLSQVQEALARIQQQTDPERDPLSQWPQERLEAELARQMRMDVAHLRAILHAGKTSLDALLQGQALLASGQPQQAGEKFDLVIQQEQQALHRLRQAYDGKAQIAYDQGRYEEALRDQEKAAALVDEDDAPLAWADAQGKVVFLLLHLARHRQAEPLARQVLRLREAHLGSDHPEVATALNNLAQLLQDTNRLVKAEPLMRRALVIDEASYGPEHPEVATALNNLALLLKATNRLTEAEPLMRRALVIDEASYGPEHPDVATALNNLALLLQATNRLAEVEPLMRRALVIDEASYGPEHPKVAIRLNNLAQLLQATNRLAEVEPLYRRALSIDEASYGPEHPDVATDLNNLARLLQATNRLAEAEPLMRRAVGIFGHFQKHTGHEHPHHKAVLGNYTNLLRQLDHSQDQIEAKIWEIVVEVMGAE